MTHCISNSRLRSCLARFGTMISSTTSLEVAFAFKESKFSVKLYDCANFGVEVDTDMTVLWSESDD